MSVAFSIHMSRDLLQWKKNDIARKIFAYLENHPDAGDTFEGIVQWWLLECKILQHSAEVKDALRYLEEQGLVLEDKKASGRQIYRINPRKKAY